MYSNNLNSSLFKSLLPECVRASIRRLSSLDFSRSIKAIFNIL